MARFDLHRAPRGARGYVLDVQADLLAGLPTRVVLPVLRPADAPPVVRDLNPVLDVGGEPHVLVTQYLAVLRRGALGPRVGNLAGDRVAITRALDTLLTGF